MALVVIAALVLVLGAILWWASRPVRMSFRNPPATSYRPTFATSGSRRRTAFPSLFDDPTVDLSLVVPAYNEEERMGVMLDETLAYLAEQKYSWEVIIVDDGSRDKTSEIGLRYSAREGSDRVRVMTLEANQGKGGAVQQGMLHARGESILMVDADGATEIKDLGRLLKALPACKDKHGRGVVVGSRAHLEKQAVAKRTFFRSVLMYGFHLLVWLFAVKTVKDTQCGFKLFSREAARVLFYNLNLRRWCFDVELLYMAEQVGIPIREEAVNWQEIPGSKLKVLEAVLLMGRDLVVVRACHTFGVWRVRHWQDEKKKNE